MIMYCVYLTITKFEGKYYKYIGSTSTINIKRGYTGSIKSIEWKNRIKNLKLKTRILSYHYTREEAYVEEYNLHLKYDVDNNSCFINKRKAIIGKELKKRTIIYPKLECYCTSIHCDICYTRQQNMIKKASIAAREYLISIGKLHKYENTKEN